MDPEQVMAWWESAREFMRSGSEFTQQNGMYVDQTVNWALSNLPDAINEAWNLAKGLLAIVRAVLGF